MRARKGRSCRTVVAAGVLVLVGVLLLPTVAVAGPDSEINGTYALQVRSDGTWQTVGSAGFGMEYSTQTLLLPEAAEQVRIVQTGGTAAQLDCVTIDGASPVAASGSADPLVVRKLSSVDDDVTQLFGSSLVLSYSGAGTVVEVRARVQGDLGGALPFEYPMANLGRPVSAESAFYSYRLTGGSPIDTGAEPFISEFTAPGTGHPDGFTHVWVADDADALRVVMDFTSDNTLDDNDDYATVHVKTSAGVKSFTVSAGDATWGTVAFTYTDKVDYQHKLYTFEIPWAQLGAKGETLQLAFSAYGTAAYIQIRVPVYRFYRAVNGAHFYTTSADEKAAIEAHPSWGYTYDGVAYVLDTGHPWMQEPLHRYYNSRTRAHFFTASDAEKAMVDAHPEWGFAYEGVAYLVSNEPVFMPVYRFRNKLNGVHFYTAGQDEKSFVQTSLGQVYELEGVAFYIQPWQVFGQ